MAIRYIPFYPEPIEGQAVLNNFKRTLRYHGTDKLQDDLRRGMPLYELDKKEEVGAPSDNLIIRGECVSACAYLREQGKKVDLVYIDPPFASGADYAKQVYIRRNPKMAAEIKAAEQELEDEDLKSFEEKMYGDVWDKEKYLNWMYENLTAIKSVMSDNASIYVHLDWHIGHYVKVLMDEIFGEDNFVNEIVWHYYNKMQGNVHRFASNHDVIFLYTCANQLKDMHFTVQAEKRENAVKQIKRIWDKEKQSLVNAKDDNGKIVYQVSKEKTIDDVWRISMLQPADKNELVGYATQKPEALLERIIKASSKEGMVVADFFGGSGVTAAVANRLGRNFIHVDIGINSVQTARDRLVAAKADFTVLEVKDGVQLYRNPVQTMDKIKELIPGLKNEDAVDEFWEGVIEDSRYGMMPVYVPNLMDDTAKLLTKDLMNCILREALPDLPGSVKRAIVYYIDIEDEAAIRKFIAEDDSSDVTIELRDMKEILDDVVLEDKAKFSLERGEGELLYTVRIDSFISDRLAQKINEYNQKAMVNTKKKFRPIVLSAEGLELIEALSLDCTNADKSAVWHSDAELKIDKLGYVIRNGVKTKEFWDGTIQSETKPLRLKIRNISGDESIYTVE